MKKTALIMAIVLAVMCLFAGCGKTEQPAADPETPAVEDPVNASLANPMVETTADDIINTFGFRFGEIEGAQDVKYFLINGDLAQMSFTKDGLDYTARIQSAGEFTDISGMNYTWTVTDDCKIGYSDGKCMRYISDTEQVDLCEWYDIAPGIMYSLSAGGEGADLDGFDITAIANQIFVPLQGEADGE